ncbi:hypothetical protein HAX54_020012 [Datura stramonium]|uniref:Uncharacterized protein n=1 Tax=Datura stramonium TaxID=4076 RepID=A0ABS8S2E8_DATST|nr:hypothetical protein [Datura stramonium]
MGSSRNCTRPTTMGCVQRPNKGELKFDARMWLDLIYSRMMPSRNISEVPIEVAILLACIMKHEVATLTVPTNQPKPCGPEMVPPQVEAPKSPPYDWWVGYHSNVDIVSDEKEDYHSPPPPPLMHSVYDVDPSWALGGGWKQHLIMSFKPFQTDGSY